MELSSFLVNSRTARWRIAVALVAALFMLMITELAYQSQREQMQAISTMGQARALLAYAVQRVTDAESGKRGFLLVGGNDYLEPYNQASRDVRFAMEQIRKLDQQTADEQMLKLQDEMSRLVDEKLGEMQTVLKEHENGRHEAAIDMVRSGIGREIMQRMRAGYEQNMKVRSERIDARMQDVQDLLLLGRIGIGAMTLLSVLILILFIRQGQTLLKEREEQRHALVRERDRLEQAVQDQLTDLKDLARHLQSAREDERARLARDLHDELGALLTTAKLDVAVIRPQVQQHLPALTPKVTHLIEALNQGIALKRRIIEDLCPSSLRTLGLAPALESLLHDMRQSSGLDMAVSLQPLTLRPDDQLTAYRVVQESITNALKYAQASRLSVRLVADGPMALIEVSDNGRGFDTTRARAGSHGIRGMRFRLEAAGGRLDIQSAPSQGTRVCAWLPLQGSASSTSAATV